MTLPRISLVTRLLPSLLLVAALSGCLSAKGSPRETGGGPSEEGAPGDLITEDEYRLNQRLTLKVGSKAYYFQGVVAVRKPSFVRAQAFGELGGRFVDLLVRPGGGLVLFRPEAMPPNPLIEGVLGDLAFLYLPSSSRVVRDAGGQVSIASQYLGKRLEREARFEGYQLMSPSLGEGGPIPTRVHLRNYRWHYRLEIETLSLHLGPLPDKVFAIPAPIATEP